MISKKSPEKILTKRGYALVKDKFPIGKIQKCRSDLNVKPFVNSDYGAEAIPYPIYLESKNKIYLPPFYGLEHFGEPDRIKLHKGSNISLTLIN